jgi:hypothetical protein
MIAKAAVMGWLARFDYGRMIQDAASQPAAYSRAVVTIHRPVSINLTQSGGGNVFQGEGLSEEPETMFRKIMFVVIALATIGAAAVPSTAQARGGWRGGGRGWGRGWGWGPAVGIGLGLAASYPYYGGAYYAYGPGPYDCWRTVRVGTPYGWRWRRVWVC